MHIWARFQLLLFTAIFCKKGCQLRRKIHAEDSSVCEKINSTLQPLCLKYKLNYLFQTFIVSDVSKRITHGRFETDIHTSKKQ